MSCAAERKFFCLFFTAGLLLVAGCGKSSDEGVWMFAVEAEGENSCAEDAVSHNFAGASLAGTEEEEEGWTSEDSVVESDSLFFGQLVEGSEGTGVLVFNELAYPGTLEGDTWTFQWVETESSTHTDAYLSDYYYEETSSQERTTTITMKISGESASGTLEVKSTYSDIWYETDVWGEEEGIDTGQIPSEDLLVLDDGEGGESPVSNARETEDCTDSRCELRSITQCNTSRAFSATLTDWLAERDYPGLENAGQDEGL